MISSLKLRGRLTVYVALLALLPLALMSVGGMLAIQRALKSQVHEMLRIEAEGLKDLVETALVERETSVRSWAEDTRLRDALRTGDTAESDAVLAQLQLRYTTFAGLVLFTDEGRVVSASTPALREASASLGANVRESDWFRAAQQGQFTSSQLTERDPVFDTQVLRLAAPVMDGSRRLGVLLAAYDWGQVDEVVKAALDRARSRQNNNFALEVRDGSGQVLFNSRSHEGWNVVNAVSVEAIEGSTMRDVGDGWHFVALADPAEVYGLVFQLRWALFVSLVIVGAVISLLALLLARTITQPLVSLHQVVRHIVSTGDLSQKLEVHSNDEVGELASSFLQMVHKLRESTESLQKGTRVLTDTVAELRRAAAQEESNITRQAAALQQTQVTAQEIKQISIIAAERAGAVLQVATRAEELGRGGANALTESMQGFQALRAQVDEMSGQISHLNERAQAIGGITLTVKGLADRSNMLALNAAIEAVRSGEHGKGFGIVAKEIRTLANQSIHSTAQVGTLLEDISQSILKTVNLSEQGQQRMDTGLEQVRTSSDSIQALSGIVQDNMKAVRQIATAVNQQNAGIQEIFNALTDMSSLMHETMAGLQATQRVSDELHTVAEQMEKVAGSYRI